MSEDAVTAPVPAQTLAADVASVARIPAVKTILDIVCRTTGMGFAAVARVTEDHWIACAVRDEIGFGLKPGSELKIETTICDEIRRTGSGVHIDHVAEDAAYRTHPKAALYGFQSYISVPIVLPGGAFFGTLCAIDPRPAKLNMPEIVGMVTLFAELIALHLDANARLAVAEAAQRNEAILQGILAASPDCVSLLAADGTVEVMNARGVDLHRLDRAEDILGTRLSALWPAESRAGIDAAIGRAANGAPARIEAVARPPGGEPRWWDVSFAPLAITATGDRRVVSVARDISQQVQATEAERRSAAALREINATLEQRVAERTLERDRIWRVSQDMLGVADATGVWLSVNPAWTRILGYPMEAFVGRTSAWLLHSDDRAAAQRARDTLADGRETVFEGRYRAQDGGYRLLSWIGVPSEGRTYSVARDITSERERDTALRDSIDFARLALGAVSGVGVWTYDVASDRFFCDAAIRELYGLDASPSAAGLLRADFLANVLPDDLPHLRATMADTLARGGDVELEYRIRHPDGSTRWVLSRGHTYLDDAGKPLRRTGVGIDMTRQRQIEEQLRQSQKMEAVGQLTGGVAHDFNNLLTVIRSSVDLLKRPNLPDDRRHRYIEAIATTTTRAAKLTGQLLAFARRQALKPEVFDVAESVKAIGDMIVTLTGSRIAIEIDVPHEPCCVNADSSQFDTSIVNLAVNARDAMGGEGTLTIKVGEASTIPVIRAHPPIEGAFVTVTIADTGSGIAPADLEHIFEPFFTTKGVGQGTGLGLSQVFGFVKQSGGEVAVHSEGGQGTAFTLYLPRVPAAERVPDPTSEPRPFVDGYGTSVLLVEDNADVGAFASQTLAELGYHSVLAVDATAALAELAAGANRFDVVFSDVVMPGINGIELAQRIRHLYADLPVVLTSGYSHVLAQQGPDGFELLHKPYSIEQLSRVLQKAAHWRRLKRVLDA